MLPLALTFGMSTVEFWEEEPDLLWAYRKSYMERKKQEADTINFQCWLAGAYIYQAFSVVLANAFAKKGSTPQKYIEKPFEINMSAEERKRAQREKIENSIRNSLTINKNLIKQKREQGEKEKGQMKS